MFRATSVAARTFCRAEWSVPVAASGGEDDALNGCTKREEWQ
jgi:hypothetical protein